MSVALFDLLLFDLPLGFAGTLTERVPLLYAEAYDSVTHDTRFGEPEARYMFGHTRRALMEFALREIATTHGMKVEMRRAEGVGGPEHVMIYAGRFCFTSCHLPTANSFPKESRHREQYAAINEHAQQGTLFPVRSEPNSADIYGIIIHCETPEHKDRLGTLSIGFPNESYDDWIQEPTLLIDLAEAQERLRDQHSDQSASPKWKQRKDRKDDEGA